MRRQGDIVNVLGVIPARGGSKGVKDKNIIEIAGKALIGYTIESAQGAKLLNKVVVSTDSQKIAKVVRDNYNVEIINRPPEMAQDDSPIEEALFHAVEFLRDKKGYNADILVWMQPNVPMRRKGVIDEVIGSLVSFKADSCVTCYEADQIPEAMKIINEKGRLEAVFNDVCAIRRQEFPKRYLLDGSVVALRVENLFKTRGVRKSHIYLGREIVPLIQNKRMYSLEVDVLEDIFLVEYYLNKIKANESG